MKKCYCCIVLVIIVFAILFSSSCSKKNSEHTTSSSTKKTVSMNEAERIIKENPFKHFGIFLFRDKYPKGHPERWIELKEQEDLSEIRAKYVGNEYFAIIVYLEIPIEKIEFAYYPRGEGGGFKMTDEAIVKPVNITPISGPTDIKYYLIEPISSLGVAKYHGIRLKIPSKKYWYTFYTPLIAF